MSVTGYPVTQTQTQTPSPELTSNFNTPMGVPQPPVSEDAPFDCFFDAPVRRLLIPNKGGMDEDGDLLDDSFLPMETQHQCTSSADAWCRLSAEKSNFSCDW